MWERELRARAARRTEPPAELELNIDHRARTVHVDGVPLSLTRLEFDLLAFLAAHPGSSFTREELLERVWGSSPDWQRIETVNEHVYRLRRKLEASPGSPRWIVTVPRGGYRFAWRVAPSAAVAAGGGSG